MSAKRKYHDDHDQTFTSDGSKEEAVYFESSPIEDRASKFIGLYSPVTDPKVLQSHKPFQSAMHRMVAWRRPSKQQSLAITVSGKESKVIYETGYDDDGEKYAGRKLEKLLIDMNLVGSVVVARWYGGILLGPVRFDHILNVAKESISKWQDTEDTPNKKPKLQTEATLTPKQEAELHTRLVKQLHDRDSSIVVLRDLLAEKKAASQPSQQVTQSSMNSQATTANSPTKINYTSMPIAKLRQLEKVRDTTISWILKQIDALESPMSEDKDK